MARPPPRSTRTDTLFPYTTLFRSEGAAGLGEVGEDVPLHAPAAHRDDIEDGNGPVRLSRLVVREEVAPDDPCVGIAPVLRSEEHTSELQSLMRISYAVFCLKKKNTILNTTLQTRGGNNKRQ